MTRVFRYTLIAGIAAAIGGMYFASPLTGQEGDKAAVAALQKAGVLQRLAGLTAPHPSKTGTAPGFVVDPAWPKTLPNNWIIGDVGGLFVDRHDHIWVYHRPRALAATDAGALEVAGKNAKGNPISAMGHGRPYGGRRSACCMPAPSVLEFDKSGTLIQAWGGPGDPGFLEKKCRQDAGCFWPAREHGIFVDQNDDVYISGNGQAKNFHGQYPWAPSFGNDSHILKFHKDGTFVYQIGTAGAKGPKSNDTNGGVNGTPQPFMVAEMSVDPKTNRLIIADGYGNRRVLIVDAATGKYIGHFGAYGQNPVQGENTDVEGESGGSWAADYRKGNTKPYFFRSPMHCAALANDGLLYTCDRGNNRIQVFKISEAGKPCENPNKEAGKCGFVAEMPIAPQTTSGTGTTVNFSADAKQSCLYVADLNNDTIYEINRQNLQEIDRFATGGRQGGQFHWPHVVSVDSEGNIYAGEVDGNGRVQKFLRYGATGCSGTGSPEVGKYNK